MIHALGRPSSSTRSSWLARWLSLAWLSTTITTTRSLSSSSSSWSPPPDRSQGPLDVVEHQLSALRRDDVYSAFKYASPSNKAVTGPWQRFDAMVRRKPYDVLVGHDRARVLLEWRERGGRGRACVVRVWPRVDDATRTRTTFREFCWRLSEVRGGDPLLDGCWMVDGVVPLDPT